MPGKSSSRRSEKAQPAQPSDYFETVVDFLPVKEADGAFKAWLREHGLTRDQLGAKDLQIDTGRGESGTVRRYRFFRDAIPR